MNLSLKFLPLSAFALFSFGVCAVNILPVSDKSKTLHFDKLSSLEFHQDVQNTIERAYKQIGYDIVYHEHPLKRSYAEASAGRLSGLMARVEQSDLKDLIMVPVALKSFKIVLVVNNMKCVDCTLSTVQNVATVSGFKGLRNVLANKNLSLELYEVHDRLTLFRMFSAERVDAIAVSEVLMMEEFLTQKSWRSEVIGEEVLYHYLHKDYAFLVPQITKALSEELATNNLTLVND